MKTDPTCLFTTGFVEIGLFESKDFASSKTSLENWLISIVVDSDESIHQQLSNSIEAHFDKNGNDKLRSLVDFEHFEFDQYHNAIQDQFSIPSTSLNEALDELLMSSARGYLEIKNLISKSVCLRLEQKLEDCTQSSKYFVLLHASKILESFTALNGLKKRTQIFNSLQKFKDELDLIMGKYNQFLQILGNGEIPLLDQSKVDKYVKLVSKEQEHVLIFN